MRQPDPSAHVRATRTSHGLGTTLTVALVMTLVPAVAVLAVAVAGTTVAFIAGAAPGTGVAFIAGAAPGTSVALARRRLRRRGTGTRRESRSAVATGN